MSLQFPSLQKWFSTSKSWIQLFWRPVSWKISYSCATCGVSWAWLRCIWEHVPALSAEETRLRQVMGYSSEGLRENSWDWKRKWCKSCGEKRRGGTLLGFWGTERGRKQLASRKVRDCGWGQLRVRGGRWMYLGRKVLLGRALAVAWGVWVWRLRYWLSVTTDRRWWGDEVDCTIQWMQPFLENRELKPLEHVCTRKKLAISNVWVLFFFMLIIF